MSRAAPFDPVPARGDEPGPRPGDGDDRLLDPLGGPLEPIAPGSVPPILGPLPGAATAEDRTGPEDAGPGGRYRRTAMPAATPAAGGESGGDALVPGEGGLAVAGGPARGLAEPLAALAAAFQANAAALLRSQEMQADLGRALQRADRSEVMVQTTGALNETFRGLTNVQRSLASRIEASERHAKEGRWFLPALVLAATALVGVALWLAVRRMGELEAHVVGNGDIATQLAEQLARGIETGRRDAGAAFEVERGALTEKLDRLDAERRAALAARDERAAAADQGQRDLASLSAEVSAARGEALRARALEAELTRLRSEAALRDPEVARLERELADERATSAGLRRRLAELATGRGTAERPSPEAGASPADERPVDRPVERREVERARTAVNDLLRASAGTGVDYLQLGSVGGASSDRLHDVVATTYASSGRVLSFVKARTLRVVADRATRRVEFVFEEGSIEMNGQSVPFPGGTFRKIVAEGDAVGRWLGSGLLLVRTN